MVRWVVGSILHGVGKAINEICEVNVMKPGSFCSIGRKGSKM